ncbi:hypothetical protein [Peribacillus sp. NPDC096448]|uniref:hypothetical protein n=1 Tax=Peribacillus sp. NPDC096448 TaxID=3364395 RepID=UPI00380AAB07
MQNGNLGILIFWRRLEFGLGRPKESPGVFSHHLEVMCMGQYLVASWQGLLQYISKNMFGNGYYYWHLTELPVQRQNKWGEIDRKLIKKYDGIIDKFKRHRRKAKGEANFRYIRFEQYVFIFHTLGTLPDVYDDPFYDVRENPFILKISDSVSFKIRINGDGKVNVSFTTDTYQGFKAMLHNVAKTQNAGLLKKTFSHINGIPSPAGVLRQKKDLVDYVIRQAEKNQLRIGDGKKKRKMNRQDFWINTKSKTVKVFVDE